jgi:predicted esterase
MVMVMVLVLVVMVLVLVLVVVVVLVVTMMMIIHLLSTLLITPARLAGCVNLSGWLPDRAKFAAALHPANQSTPALWGHGTQDEVIAFGCQQAGVAAMQEAGVPVTAVHYDMGHDSSEKEFADVLQVT